VDEKNLGFDERNAATTMSLRDLVAPLFRHRRLVVVSFVGIFLGAGLATFLLPRQYQAEMKILVRSERVDPIVTADKTTLVESHPEVTEEQLQSEVELLKSRDLLEQVVRTCRLDSIRQQATAEEPDAQARLARAVRTFENTLQADPIKKTNLIMATYRSHDPVLAAQVLNTLAALYLEKHVAVHRLPGAFDFFQKQTERYRDDLAETEAQLTHFDQEAGMVSPELEKEIALRKMSDFDAALQQTQADIAETTERVRALEAQITATSPRITTEERTSENPALLAQLKSTLLSLEVKHTDLLGKFAADYPPVRDVEKEIAQAQAAIATAEKAPIHEQTTDRDPTYAWLREELAKNRTQLTALRARREALVPVVEAYRAKARSLGQKDATQQDLVRATKAAEEDYLLYLQKQEEARISDALDRNRIVNVAIAEAATVPALPMGSPWLTFLAGGALAALVSVGSAFGADYLDPSFRAPRDLHNALRLPVLAAIPREER
jgi:uncharacterized protein involved in exopolysaccharide biosynthesis